MFLLVVFLNERGQGENPVVHGVIQTVGIVSVFLDGNAQTSAVGQLDPVAQTAVAAKSIQHPGDRPRVPAQFRRFALKPVDFLDDLDGQNDAVFLKVQQRVWIVQ